MMKMTIAKLALATAALAAAPIAHAAEPEARSARVTYADLDLTTKEGLAELDRRVSRAAAVVCDLNDITVGTRIRSREARECFEQAKRQIDSQFAQIKRNAALGG